MSAKLMDKLIQLIKFKSSCNSMNQQHKNCKKKQSLNYKTIKKRVQNKQLKNLQY